METIVVAAIGAGGLIVSTWIQSHRTKKVTSAIGETLGEKNGSTIVEKLDCIHAWTLRHEGRHDILERDWDER